MRKFMLFSFVAIQLSACTRYTVNEAGWVRPPKHYKFSYRKKAKLLTDLETIDTTVIYVMQNHNLYRNSAESKYTDRYIRFYGDGRLKMQFLEGSPRRDDVNDIRKGLVGYYRLQGKVVKLQVYSDMNGGTDHLEFGLVDEDKNLVLLEENPRTNFRLGYSEAGIRKKMKKSFYNPKVYKKIPIAGMRYEAPDW